MLHLRFSNCNRSEFLHPCSTMGAWSPAHRLYWSHHLEYALESTCSGRDDPRISHCPSSEQPSLPRWACLERTFRLASQDQHDRQCCDPSSSVYWTSGSKGRYSLAGIKSSQWSDVSKGQEAPCPWYWLQWWGFSRKPKSVWLCLSYTEYLTWCSITWLKLWTQRRLRR